MLSHIVLALAIQVFTVWLLRNWFAGAFAASAWAISREITQAEYRWIEWFGEGRRANMSWWEGLDPRVWHLDALLDWIVPCLLVFTLATIATSRRRPKTNSTIQLELARCGVGKGMSRVRFVPRCRADAHQAPVDHN